MQIAKNTVVMMHYRLSDTDGNVLDASEEGDPLTYLHGHSQIISGLEQALEGKEAGSHVETTIAPADGYGEYDESLNLQLPLDVFPADARSQLQPGVQFMAPNPAEPSEQVLFTVVSTQPESVRITGNHPLAGKTLVFAIDVLSVRAATAQELAHGHAHAHGHDH